jgi:hypothetical protein
MTEMVTRHAATCIGLWEKGRPPTEPSLTEEQIVAELKTYALRDTADGRATVREAFGRELAEARREIKRDKKVLYGVMWSFLTAEGQEALRMARDFDEMFFSQDAEALRNLIWRTHQTPVNAMSRREQIDAALDMYNNCEMGEHSLLDYKRVFLHALAQIEQVGGTKPDEAQQVSDFIRRLSPMYAVLKSEVVNLHRTGDEAKIPKTLNKAIEWVWAWMPLTGVYLPRGTSIKAPRHQAVFKT